MGEFGSNVTTANNIRDGGRQIDGEGNNGNTPKRRRRGLERTPTTFSKYPDSNYPGKRLKLVEDLLQ